MTSPAMQRAVYTIEEEVFSMWFPFVHCWATDVSSMGPPRDYLSCPVVNHKSVAEREREWSDSSRVPVIREAGALALEL
jgi:hypothetical protein